MLDAGQGVRDASEFVFAATGAEFDVDGTKPEGCVCAEGFIGVAELELPIEPAIADGPDGTGTELAVVVGAAFNAVAAGSVADGAVTVLTADGSGVLLDASASGSPEVGVAFGSFEAAAVAVSAWPWALPEGSM